MSLEEAMPEKYISILDLLQNKKLFLNGKPRSKSGFLRLLRDTYKVKIFMVRFPGMHHGREVAAITQADADELIKKMTSPQVREAGSDS
jgi:hypothetical protein